MKRETDETIEGELPDQELVDRICQDAGNETLWTLLFRRFQPMLYSKAYRLCNGNLEDTEDLLQEIHINLVDAIPRYEGGASVKTYIWRVAHYTCCHIYSAERRREFMVNSQTEDNGVDIIDMTPSNLEDADIEVYAEEAISDFRHFKEREPSYWEMIKFHFEEELPHKEIAQRLNIGVIAARVRLCRAVTALREFCAQKFITADLFHRVLTRV